MDNPRNIIVELCQHFYRQGWVSGTGGGVSIRDREQVYMAPSGVQKERLREEDIFVLNMSGKVVAAPSDEGLRVSACAPLFFHAFCLRGAGAVVHSHSINALLASLTDGDRFVVTHLEMQKGIEGVGFYDRLEVPIIENTAHECDLADTMAEAIRRFPNTHAVLVRRHGVYVWGGNWQQAKTHAECYDYLFDAACRMRQMGIDPTNVPRKESTDEGTLVARG